jgi:hypothetical protein
VARRGALLKYSEITPVDAALQAGNRFDVPGGGVIYAGTDLQACYAETLSRFRPTPVIRAAVGREDEGFMVTGGIPQDWRLRRTAGVLNLPSPLPFLDVEDPATHAHLSEVMAAELLSLGYQENLDVADVRGDDRLLTRAIAEYAYTATELDGSPLYSGIRYLSRVNTAWECWAIFDGTEIDVVEEGSIELTDPCFMEVVDMWGLRAF